MMLKKIQNPRLNYVSRILALSILLVTVLAFTLRTRDSVASNTTLDKQVTVVIDAGHGIMPNGKPNGIAIGNAIEDGIVLAIAKKIQELNTNDKLKIVLSRTSDKIIDLHTRVDIAKENKADLFVSLHTNAFAENASPDLNADQSLKSGFCIYVSNGHPLYQQQSEKLGSAMQQQLNSIYPTNANLLKRNVGIWVLDQNVCPSVLIECGYLTDKKDREFITQDKNQTAVAQNILRAVEQYALSQQENGNTSLNLMINHDLAVAAGHRPANPGTQKDRINVNTRDTTKELPIFIVDGKEVSKEDAYKIDPNTIQSINISKDATEKYGKRGQGGVVEIKLKEHKSASDITFEQNGKIMATGTIKIDPSTNSFEANLKAVNHQQNDSIPNGQPIFTKVETEASVNKEEWSTFLRKNLQSVIELGAICGMKPGTYTVQLRFIVKQDGSLSEIEALNDPGYELAEKTVAFMKESPKWNPGLQNGRPVNSYHTQPITFVIQEQ